MNGSRLPQAQLAEPGLLRWHTAVRLYSDPSRAVFIGVYGKQFFRSLSEFVGFTMNISSVTQDWYSTGDLDAAYAYYYPPDTEDGSEGERWLTQASVAHRSLADWLRDRNIETDLSRVPSDIAGTIYSIGDESEFSLCGEAADTFFEAFIADLVEEE